MKRRIIAVSLLALALSAGQAVAQGNPQGGPPQGGGQNFASRRLQALLANITLTPVQQTSIDSITQAFATRMPPMQQGVQLDSAQRAERMQLSQQRDAAYKAVLTAEQQRVWETNLANMPQGRPRP